MSDHALAEGLAGLASRIDDLARATAGDDSRTLKEQEDRVAKLALVAIAQEMDATNAAYGNAVARVNAAIAEVGQADKRIEHVAQAIKLVATALDAAEKLLKKAGGV